MVHSSVKDGGRMCAEAGQCRGGKNQPQPTCCRGHNTFWCWSSRTHFTTKNWSQICRRSTHIWARSAENGFKNFIGTIQEIQWIFFSERWNHTSLWLSRWRTRSALCLVNSNHHACSLPHSYWQPPQCPESLFIPILTPRVLKNRNFSSNCGPKQIVYPL